MNRSNTSSRNAARSSRPRASEAEAAKPARKRAAPAKSSKPKAKATEGETTFVHGVGFVKAKPGSILDAAKKVASSPKARKTVTKKKPEPVKRVDTDPKVLERAVAFFDNLIAERNCTKVDYVRELAMWPKGEKQLQRRDVFAIIASKPKLEIANATVATQFQAVRAGAVQLRDRKAAA
jgi:hypothetical protein